MKKVILSIIAGIALVGITAEAPTGSMQLMVTGGSIALLSIVAYIMNKLGYFEEER